MSGVPSISSMFRQFYGTGREYRFSSTRTNSPNHDVVQADNKAMKKALKALDDLDFDNKDPENTKKIYNTVMSFVDTYNNAVESAKDSATKKISSKANGMKEAVKEYSKQLEELGITVKSNGKLSVNKSELKTATLTKVRKVFEKDSGFADALRNINKKISRQLTSEPVTNGGGIDVKA